MGDILRAGAQLVNDALAEHASQDVVYRRGADQFTVAATNGTSRGSTAKEYGVREHWTARDFLISASALVLLGQQIEPAEGDQIVETITNDDDEPVATVTHTVLPPSTEEPAWRYSDPTRKRVRLHTKETARESIP